MSLRRQGIGADSITALDRLAHIGARGMGAEACSYDNIFSGLDENGRIVDEIVGSTLTPQCDCVTIFPVKTSRIWKIRVR